MNKKRRLLRESKLFIIKIKIRNADYRKFLAHNFILVITVRNGIGQFFKRTIMHSTFLSSRLFSVRYVVVMCGI